MPYLHRFTRVTISGTAFNGAEEWSTGFNLGYVAGDADLPTQAQADAIRDAWRVFFIAGGHSFSSSYESTLVKVSSIGTDGKSNAADTVYANFPVQTKGASGERLPAQISLVATLLGPDPRGVASKGRMYLPGIFAGVGLDGKIGGFLPGDLADGLKTMFNSIMVNDPSNNVLMLASPGSLNKDGTPRVGGSGPKNAAVTQIKVGNVFDTQRRRRNAFSETYQIRTLAA